MNIQVNDIISDGERSFDPLQYYIFGVRICKNYGFYKKEAILHCKIANIYLFGGYFTEAILEAENALILYPDYEDVSC